MGSNEDLLLWVQTIGTRFGFATASTGPGGGGATCDPVRPSEVLSGASSSQYSTGEITDETAAEGQDFTSGTRENAESDDFDQAVVLLQEFARARPSFVLKEVEKARSQR